MKHIEQIHLNAAWAAIEETMAHDKIIAQLEAKLKRQTENVIATQDLINTLKSLQGNAWTAT